MSVYSRKCQIGEWKKEIYFCWEFRLKGKICAPNLSNGRDMKKYNTNQSKNDGEKMHLKKACDKQGVLKKFKSYKQYPPKYLILIAEEKKYISANKEEQD